jgi:hypothetical protein
MWHVVLNPAAAKGFARDIERSLRSPRKAAVGFAIGAVTAANPTRTPCKSVLLAAGAFNLARRSVSAAARASPAPQTIDGRAQAESYGFSF